MLRRNKHFGPRPRIEGRPRLLDPEKKVELCEHVAKGASVEDAAETVGVSLRTVQRERKLDEDFDHELQLSLRQAPDPLKMMQHAARAHWRAAAWLLERTDPEKYAKRAKNSASPAQFDAGLEFVMEAALAAIPPELHEQVYEYMAAAAEEAFACLFPNFGRWGDSKRPKLPPTPLVQRQFRHRHADPKFQRVIAENELGRIIETVPPQLPPHLQPRALPGGPIAGRNKRLAKQGDLPTKAPSFAGGPAAGATGSTALSPGDSPSGAPSCSRGRQPRERTHKSCKTPAGPYRPRAARLTPSRGTLAHASTPQRLPLQPPTSVAKNAIADKSLFK